MRAVRRLPLPQRQVLMLALEELSHAESAQILGISENAVATRLHRARERLRAELESS
jgi:RNA polymerase sigma-70 factor (ECF subfamily)